MALPLGIAQEDETYSLDSDDIGKYIELCAPRELGNVILGESQRETMSSTDLATVRIYVSAASKRAVVAKEDDLPTKQDIADNPKTVADALCADLKIWLGNNGFRILDTSNAESSMTSRYAYKWKLVKDDKGNHIKTMRLRRVLRGFMRWAAFDVDLFFRNVHDRVECY